MCLLSLVKPRRHNKSPHVPMYVPVSTPAQHSHRHSYRHSHRGRQPSRSNDNTRGYISGYNPADKYVRRRAGERVMDWDDGFNGGQVEWSRPG